MNKVLFYCDTSCDFYTKKEEGCPILSSRFHQKKGSYESLDSSNGESLLTIRQVELLIGNLHLISGT